MTVDYSLLRPEIAALLIDGDKLPKADFKSMTDAWGRIIHTRAVCRITEVNYSTFRIVDAYAKVADYGHMLVRIYIPKASSKPLPVLVHYHGGGWSRGHVNSHDNICIQIANLSECIVVAVDYPLAPEFKFPIIIEACFEALQWVYLNASKFGGDNLRIGVIGSSAGANLATAMTLMARDRAQSWSIQCQILVCPPTDMLNLATPSYSAFGGYDDFTRETMLWFRDKYLENHTQAGHPYVSPLLAENLSDLPHALIVTAEFDILLDDGILYTEKLKHSGNSVTYHCMQKMVHSGIFWSAAVPAIDQDIKFICEEIKKINKHK